MSTPILELIDLSKSFRSYWTFLPKEAVSNVSLAINTGEAFGFLGQNGAGKTTTIKCIVGLIHRSSGEILLNGQALRRASQRTSLGYLPEQPYFYDHLTVCETLQYFAALHDIPRSKRSSQISKMLELTGLAPRAKDSVRVLSKGWQQRLGLAQAIINEPKLLLLDEPFSGLDPLARIEIRQLILDLKSAGTTIFMSSHILSDVAEICDRVAIMAHGKLRTTFPLSDVPQMFGQTFRVIFSELSEDSACFAEIKALATSYQRQLQFATPRIVLQFSNHGSASTAVAIALAHKATLISYQEEGMKLEDIFVKVAAESQTNSQQLQDKFLQEQRDL